MRAASSRVMDEDCIVLSYSALTVAKSMSELEPQRATPAAAKRLSACRRVKPSSGCRDGMPALQDLAITRPARHRVKRLLVAQALSAVAGERGEIEPRLGLAVHRQHALERDSDDDALVEGALAIFVERDVGEGKERADLDPRLE